VLKSLLRNIKTSNRRRKKKSKTKKEKGEQAFKEIIIAILPFSRGSSLRRNPSIASFIT